MQIKKKERLYIQDILDNPTFSFPAYYTLTKTMIENEMLLDTLCAIHSYDFNHFKVPVQHDEIFRSLEAGVFVIYKEKYAVGYFGGKLMYLESNGWKSFNLTKDVFDLQNWLTY